MNFKPTLRRIAGLALGSLLCLASSRIWAAALEHDGLPNLDRRLERQIPVNAAAPAALAAVRPERAAAEAALRARLPELQLERHPITRSPKWLSATDGFLTAKNGTGRGAGANIAAAAAGVRADDPHRVAKSFVNEHAALFGHDASVLDRAAVRRDYVTEHSGMRTTVWHQEHEGLEVFEAVFLAHMTKDGELVNVSSQFVPDEVRAAGQARAAGAAGVGPAISAERAIRNAALSLKQEGSDDQRLTALDAPAGTERKQRFNGAITKGEALVRLVWLPMDEGTMRLCWRVLLKTKDSGARYRVLVDADTGEVWKRDSMTSDISPASYRVFTGDSPTPFSPGYATPGNTNQPAQVSRQLVTLSALNTTASPLGWIIDGDNQTRGNNIDAHTDVDADDDPDLPRPIGTSRVFDFPLNLTQSPSTYRDAAVVNLFYWCNWMHDKTWELGFTEGAGNFQNNNFGRGGVGGDAVQAQAQDGEDLNNANFSYTDADGELCQLQMFLWDGPQPDRDGDFDAEVIIHEYTHGVSQRLVGGGVGISEFQSKALGEGWSDFFALALLSQAGDDLDGVYPVAGYAYQLRAPGYLENYYYGIRHYPYSTDMTKNPVTFRDLDYLQRDPHEDVPSNPTSTALSGIHDYGSFWAVTLWDARARLITKYGFVTGNQLMLQLVTDGMKLSPPNPTYVQVRNAIYQADMVLNGGANLTDLREVFARRGLGYYASAPDNTTLAGLVEDFETGPTLRIFPPNSLVFEGPVGGPFNLPPLTFNLVNNTASAVAWSVVAAPPLEASPVNGSVPGGATRNVSLTLDANAAAFFPVGTNYLNIAFSNHVTHTVRKFLFTLKVVSDAESLVENFTYGREFDLGFRSVTFTPDGTNAYEVCRDVVSSYRASTFFATTLHLPIDGYAKIDLSGGQRVRLFGKQYASVYVSEDGAIALSPPPATDDLSLSNHFAQPRVSGLFMDVATNASSRISWQQLPDRFVATWDKVKLNGYVMTNSFQIEMFTNGVLRITFLNVDSLYGVVGLSAGGGMPAGFVQADFSSHTGCNIPPLKLTLPATVTEGITLPTGVGRVSIPAARNIPTLVNLASSDTTELTVQSSVFIPIHETNATFNVTVINDSVRDGSQLVYVTATAVNYLDALERVRVDDNENNPLAVSVPLLVSESQGEFAGVITVPNPVSGVVTVFLSASRTNEVDLPPVAFIPAGQTSTVFTANVIDDRRIDGNLQTIITASVPNWTSGSDTISIFDNEDRLLRLRLPLFVTEGAGTMTNAGEVYLSGTLETNLTLSLGSSNFFAMFPLGPVTIQAGQTNAKFSLAVGDNADIDGLRLVQIYATAPPFSNAVSTVLLFDNDYPPEPANPYPPDDSVDWPLHTHLAWDVVEGELIVNGNFETGDFTSWLVGGFGGGGFMLNDGTFDPDSPDGALPPLAGNYDALAIQNGNGKHTLSQEIYLPDGATSTMLKWTHDIRNHAGTFAANHRFAVELRRATDDTLLATVFSTQPGDTAFAGPTNRTASLQAYRGEHVRLVFVEEDSLGHLNVHLDNISLIAGAAEPTTFDVYFGNDTTPDESDYVGSTTNAYWDLLPLAGGLNYYWRIDSRRLGITNTGPVWNFQTLGSSIATVPLTFGSAWKYVATGVNLGTGWRSPGYNDVLWQTDVASFGYGSSENTTIGAARADYITFYFRRRLTVFDTNRLATVTASLRRDDGAVVYVNGIEAFRDNMPAGSITYLTQAASIVTGADETNSHVHAIDPSLFIEGTNIIAVEVHQHDNGFPSFGPSPDLFFDFALTFRTNTGALPVGPISWLVPADFALVRAPTNVQLRVGVGNTVAFSTYVQFFADGELLGQDNAGPFTLTWSNAPIGAHTLIAVATGGGLSITSAPRHIIVAPSVGQTFLTLVPAGAVWRYRDNGEYPGATWTQLGFKESNDRSWAGGPAQLGYGDGDEATAFRLEPDRFDKPITTYLRHRFTNSIAATELKLRVLRDDGVAVYLNGGEVFRNNLPNGTPNSNTLALTTITGAAENTWLTANLSSALLDNGGNIVAAELHQSSTSTPDASFDLELTALGNVLPSVILTSPADNSVAITPASVPLAATASDPYGAVTNVQFHRNGVLIGNATTPPHQFLWNNPPPGLHSLTAVATDIFGASTISGAVSLFVGVTTPLALTRNGSLLELTWPDTAPGYNVESTTNLAAPVLWTPVTNVVMQSGGLFRMIINVEEVERYFHLRAP